jgi:5'-3' exonuclease
MGIKYFFSWFKSNFENRIKKIKSKDGIINEEGIIIDNFLIDMNGIFHNCAQKIYQYGNHKSNKSLLFKKKPRGGLSLQIKFFEEITNYISKLFDMVIPQKTLILCVDGVAPISKQNQQRQRRFKASLERKDENEFDSNCFTPGTVMMDYICKYIDWFIRKKITEDERWRKIEVVFSNEKVPGEGEHKLKNYIKKYGSDDETFMVQGMDADLIMLSLATNKEHFYILREDHRSTSGEFYILDVDNFKADVLEKMMWDIQGKPFYPELGIYDFILMCFSVGNDFLPHIPTIDILEGGLELLFESYKRVGTSYGHLTYINTVENKKTIGINKKAYEVFIGTLAQREPDVLNNRMNQGTSGYEDTLLIKYSTFTQESEEKGEEEDILYGRYKVNFDKYRRGYYRKSKTKMDDVKNMCHDYITGLSWIINYYVKDVPSWSWNYQHHYSPFLCDLTKHMYSWTEPRWFKGKAILPFQQLLCVLPTKSRSLIASPLDTLISEESKLSDLYPTEFKIDLEGKKNEWEGVVILPFVNLQRILQVYEEEKNNISEKDAKRNIVQKTMRYSLGKEYTYKSFYGDISNCLVYTNPIEL